MTFPHTNHRIKIGSVGSRYGELLFYLNTDPDEAWSVDITAIEPGNLRKTPVLTRLHETDYQSFKHLIGKIDQAIQSLQDMHQQNLQKLFQQLRSLDPETLKTLGIEPVWLQSKNFTFED